MEKVIGKGEGVGSHQLPLRFTGVVSGGHKRGFVRIVTANFMQTIPNNKYSMLRCSEQLYHMHIGRGNKTPG